MNHHPGSEAIESFRSGALNEPDARAVRLHLEQCEPCRTQLHRSECDERLFGEIRAAVREVTGSAGLPARFEDPLLIRSGGQATVYGAFDRVLQRRVALKVLPPGATARARQRLEREVELLRPLEHSAIARVLDAEVDGDPGWLAMELVEGESLAEWNARRPALRARLELFARICDAVAYAHRGGVLHRDLKPANVIVRAGAEPVVLDFGVARSLGPSARDGSLTVPGEFLGTPAYIAPERANGRGPTRADTRSDVYSLGVLLYELLTGATPLDADVPLPQLRARLLEKEPIDPRRRAPGTPKDVATIALRALATDPERRTQSAEALAADVRRYLAGEPIEARRDHLVYALGMRLRRHPRTAAAAGIATIWIALFAGMWLREHLRVERQQHTAAQLRQIFQDLLAEASPVRMGPQVTLLDVFEDVARRVDQELERAPDAQAAVQWTIGDTYLDLLLFDAAEPHLRAAVERLREFEHEDPLALARALDSLGRLLAGKSSAEAVPVHREALRLRTAALGPADALVAISERGLAEAISEAYPKAQAAEAPEDLLHDALELLTRALGADSAEVAITLTQLAEWETYHDRLGEASQHFARALELFDRVAPDHPRVLRCLDGYATLLRRQERFDEAEAMLYRSIERTRELHGEAMVVEVLRGFANLHFDRGDYPTSRRFCAEALALRLDQWRDRRPERAARMEALARELRDGTRAPPFVEAFSEVRAIAGPGAFEVAQWMLGVAVLLTRTHEDEVAEALTRDALTIGCRRFGGDCPVRVRGLELLASRCLATGRGAEARPLLEEIVATRRRVGTLDAEAERRLDAQLAQCVRAKAGG